MSKKLFEKHIIAICGQCKHYNCNKNASHILTRHTCDKFFKSMGLVFIYNYLCDCKKINSVREQYHKSVSVASQIKGEEK